MPKKQCKNAFWYFMAEWKAHEERKGKEFPNGFRDVQADPDCNAAWRALTPTEKLPYTNRAKDAKLQIMTGKRAGTGEYIELINQEKQELEDFNLTMEGHIRYKISNAKRINELAGLKFPFIHLNVYYLRKPDDGPEDYCPAEFAIGEFSIENGISTYYHEIVRTELHLGYTRDAMEMSERTHKLHWNMSIAEGDWAIMYYKMMEFLKSFDGNSDRLPPIYTMNKYMPMLPSLFRRMAGAVGQTPEKFTVYSLESLFAQMLYAVSDHSDSNVVGILAQTQLQKELFAFTPDIECDFHKTKDGSGRYCSLSIIRQWAFEFCDQCCKPLKVEMMPGVHYPAVPDAPKKPMYSSMMSIESERSLNVLSATGVSEGHRIAVSERTRDEMCRRKAEIGTIEFVDHSKLPKKNERSREPEEIAVPIPYENNRLPPTTSQMVMGQNRAPPAIDNNNFPALGGRGKASVKVEQSRKPGSVWSYRASGKSDSDSD